MRSKITLLAILSVSALSARAAIELSDGIKVIPSLTAGVQFNDNLFLNPSNEQDETMWTIAPGVAITSGEGALNSTQFSINEQFQLYSDHSGLNTNLTLVDLVSTFDDGKMKIGVNAWYHEANQATRSLANVASLVERNLIHAEINDEVLWSDKSSVKVGVAYDETNYKPAGYRDWQWFEVPVKYYYKYQPKLDLSAGVRYRSNKIDGVGGVDSNEIFYNVGARGEITPKLIGEVSVGYISFDPDTGGSKSSIGLDSSLALALTPKSSLNFTASNRYGYGAVGDSYRVAAIGGGFTTAITTDFSLSGSLAYNKYDYIDTNRTDDFWSGNIGATYAVSRNLSVNGTYLYSNNDSDLPIATFKNSILALSATFQF
jgi:hypothetical protein